MGLGSCSRARPGRSTATVRNQLRPTARTQLACASLRAAVYTTTSPLFLALHSPRSPFSPSSSLCRPLPDLSRALRPSTSATPAPFPLGLPSRLAPRILFSVRGSSSYPAVRYICRRTVLSLLRTPIRVVCSCWVVGVPKNTSPASPHSPHHASIIACRRTADGCSRHQVSPRRSRRTRTRARSTSASARTGMRTGSRTCSTP